MQDIVKCVQGTLKYVQDILRLCLELGRTARVTCGHVSDVEEGLIASRPAGEKMSRIKNRIEVGRRDGESAARLGALPHPRASSVKVGAVRRCREVTTWDEERLVRLGVGDRPRFHPLDPYCPLRVE
jgi:hypothetical protein